MTAVAPLVILSGGAESVSVAVAEAAWRDGKPYAVVSLVPRTILSGAAGCIAEISIWEKNLSPDLARAKLLDALTALRRQFDAPLSVLPTEDDGLCLLNELGKSLDGIAEFSRARSLAMGGLDKAELFEFLEAAGFGNVIAPTRVLNDVADFDAAIGQLGSDAVFKPAFKPWGTSVGPSGLKVIRRKNEAQPLSEVKQSLAAIWQPNRKWVAQARLEPLRGGEWSACIVRANTIAGCEVIERLKYPRAGGSAVWVSSSLMRDLFPIAESIAKAIDVNGICEMSFLADREGRPRLIELNTRPWLQIELVEKSGYPIVAETIAALEGRALREVHTPIVERNWIHLERLMLSWLSGDCGPRMEVARRIFRALNRETVFAVYSARLPRMRARWIMRNLRKLANFP